MSTKAPRNAVVALPEPKKAPSAASIAHIEDSTPGLPPRSHAPLVDVSAILGTIKHKDGDNEQYFKGAGNSTRWIFDFHAFTGETVGWFGYDFSLADNYNRAVTPHIMTFSLAPLGAEFYGALPYLLTDSLTLMYFARGPDLQIALRVSIDAIHSASR